MMRRLLFNTGRSIQLHQTQVRLPPSLFSHHVQQQQQQQMNQYATIRFDRAEEGSIYIENNRYYKIDKVSHNHKSRGGAIISMDSIDVLTGKKYSKRMKSTDTLDVIDPTSVVVKYKGYSEEDGVFYFVDADDSEIEYEIDDERVWESDYKLLRKNVSCRLWGHENDDGELTILGAKIEEDTFVLKVKRVREGEGTADRTIKVEVGDFGLVIRLPAHIKAGDYIRLSNQGNYLERAEADEVEQDEEDD